MTSQQSDGFWEGGEEAWWRGLEDAIKAADERLKQAATAEERREAQSQLDELKRQEADAKQNGDQWLF